MCVSVGEGAEEHQSSHESFTSTRFHFDPSKGSGRRSGQAFDEVYKLAADMGGMGFISVAECEVLRNNALISSRCGRRKR